MILIYLIYEFMLKDLFYTVLIKLQEFYFLVLSSFKTLPALKRKLLLFLLISLIPGYFLVRFGSELAFTFLYNRSLVFARPSFTNPDPVKVGKVEILSLSGGVYSAYVEVENQNLDLVADNIGYNFRFYNSKNEEVYSSKGNFYLLLGEKKFVVLPKFVSTESVTFGKFEVSEVKWQKRFIVPKAPLATSSVNLSEQPGTGLLQISGTVQNNSPYALRTVGLQFFIYDSVGKVKMVSSRDEFALKSSERRAYSQIISGLSMADVSRVVVYARTNVLDLKNLSSDGSGSSNGSSLERPERDGF